MTRTNDRRKLSENQMRRRAVITVIDDEEPSGDGLAHSAVIYDLDLDAEEARHLQRLLDEYSITVLHEDGSAARAWARRQGLPVTERGRIPQEVWRRYHEHLQRYGVETVADAINQAAQDSGENVVRIAARQRKHDNNN